MISIFRRFIGSKLGAIFAVVFLGMIGFAFVAGDLSGKRGVSLPSFLGGGYAAKVGGSTLSDSEVQSRVQRVFEQQRRDSPGMQIDAFLAQDGVNIIYNQLVAGLAIMEFAKAQGIHISKPMIDAQIAAIPAFQDASGKFSQTAFRQLLSSQGVNEKALRDDIARDVTGRILVGSSALGARLPDSLVLPYASLMLETRQGRIAAIPAMAFLPKTDPNDAQVKSFYAANANRFTIPEQRKFRYAVIDADRFLAAATPNDQEISAFYALNKARFAAKETRSIEQLILPTQSAATSVANDVKAGKSLGAAASAAGLSVATFNAQAQADLARQSSDDVAKAAFAATQGASVGPLRSAFGWAVIRVTGIQRTPETTLDQARPVIIGLLKDQKQARLLSDFTGKLEDQIANGATFDEVVKDNGLAVETTPALIATGQNVLDPAYKPSTDMAPLLKPGFGMDADDDAQLAQIVAQKRYALLDVTDVIAAAPPPLDTIRPAITQMYKLHAGAEKAREMAAALQAKIAKGMPLEQALASAGVPLPPVQKAGGRRADLMRQDKRAPAEVAILFAMKPGSVKLMPIGDDRGTFLIQLDAVAQGDAAKVPGLTERIRADLSNVVASEYSEQFEHAIERDLGVKRNANAVATVTHELRRINGATPPAQ
ncbi:MAG: peptidyl-prolyl cis-trans isomerase [Sphingobium sp.]